MEKIKVSMLIQGILWVIKPVRDDVISDMEFLHPDISIEEKADKYVISGSYEDLYKCLHILIDNFDIEFIR